ncbi:MAG: hypothetical protein IJB25_09885 [Clostridia bacterium]|nr:hypothetical protein [Clostridia bacterium]
MKALTPYAHRILNDEAAIQKRDLWFSRLQNLFDGKKDAFNEKHIYTVSGICPRPADPFLPYTHPEDWVIECLELLALAPETQSNRFVPPCVEYPIYGVHFIDKMFGADVFFKDGQWNARYLKTPIGSLKMPDLETDETWALARRATKAFLDADVRLPLFGLPTLSSALNIMVNLYGGEALIAMIEEEEAAKHDLAVINDLIRTLHRWYIKTVPAKQLQPVISWERTQPPGFGQLCGCTTQLLSGEMYARLIAPLDDALLGDYPNGGMIHLCGAHTQHIPAFRAIKNLRALQLNDRASHDLKQYLDGLRDDQIIYLAPCEGMSVQKAIEISKGKRIVFPCGIDAPEKPQI